MRFGGWFGLWAGVESGQFGPVRTPWGVLGRFVLIGDLYSPCLFRRLRCLDDWQCWELRPICRLQLPSAVANRADRVEWQAG